MANLKIASKEKRITDIASMLERGMERKAIPKYGYYVYAIYENSSVCYIGKGKGTRVLSHFIKSTNINLRLRMEDNKSKFEYGILACFETEYASLELEKNIISHCKNSKIKLCNIINYSQHKRHITNIVETIIKIQKSFFEIPISTDVLSNYHLTHYFMDAVKDFCRNIPIHLIPSINGKKINCLSFSVYESFGKERIAFK